MSAITITKENFRREVLESEKPVLLDFWAAWCGPCKAVAPVLDEISESGLGIKVGKVNVDEQGELVQEYRVMSIPTLMVIKDGQVVNRALGAMPRDSIISLFE